MVGGQIKYSLMASCIMEAGLVGGANTHRSSIDINHEVVCHTLEPFDYCPKCLRGEQTCVSV